MMKSILCFASCNPKQSTLLKKNAGFGEDKSPEFHYIYKGEIDYGK